MTERDRHTAAVLSELTNALQTAAPLAAELRRTITDQAEDLATLAATLDTALTRAVSAVRQLQPTPPGA